jgi:6-phosphogluconolactonase (cycloisomerase 2 family)
VSVLSIKEEPVKRSLTLLVLVAALLAFAASASAAGGSSVGVAYTISNAASGNELVVYSRSADGSLAYAGSVWAGGAGTGGGLASQAAVAVTDDGRYVLAVNPGSNGVAAFDVTAGGPQLLNTAPSGGIRPVSVDVHKQLVYVLNKNNAALATVSGFTLGKEGLTPIPGSTRFLHAGATDAGQVRFSPGGDVLVVTGRSSQRIDTFRVGADGLLSDLRSFDVAPGATPFGFDFDNKGHLLVSLAGVGGSSGVGSYAIGPDGELSTITAPLETGERAACWLVASKNGRFAFVANAASSSVSTFDVSPGGELSFRGALTIDGMTPLDLALSESGRYLYVLAAGSHGIVAFEVGGDGTLTHVDTEANVPAAAAGIAVR